MRPIRALIACCVLVACNRGDAGGRDRVPVDPSQFSSSSGEVALSDGGSLEFSITSEQYKQWYKAHQGLDRRIASRFGALLQPASPSERSIGRAVQYLEGEPSARRAIEGAGMSVRGFVVTTVALEQEMRVASESAPRPDTMPLPAPYPYPSPYPPDSAYPAPYPTPAPYPPPAYPPTYPPAYPVVPAYPAPLPERRVDSTSRVDTVYLPAPTPRDTTPARRDTITPSRSFIQPSRDTVVPRRDTLAPKRDTLPLRRDTVARRRDTLPAPRPPRDTVRRDTLPRDTLLTAPPRSVPRS